MANTRKRPLDCPVAYNYCLGCNGLKYRTSKLCKKCTNLEARPRYLHCGDFIIAATKKPGEIFILSAEDEVLLQQSWHTSGYIPKYVHHTGKKNGKSFSTTLHREVMLRQSFIADNLIVDHKNWCGVDNQRKNLRNVTSTLNNMHRRPRNNTGITGVRYLPERSKIYPYEIRCQNRRIKTKTLEEAIKIRQDWEAEVRRLHAV